jgi:hypothetical protein
LLWQTFPLRERATHQLGPKLHHEAPIARKANSELPVPATQATKTFPGAVIIDLLAVTMLAAVALFIARRPASAA